MKRVLTAGRITTKGRDRVVVQYALAADGESVLGVMRYQAPDAHPVFRTALAACAKSLEDYREAGITGTIDK